MLQNRARVKTVSLVQGLYFTLTGIWPILHLRSFEAITGRKRDRWLVKTVGGLIAVVGASLAVGAFEETSEVEDEVEVDDARVRRTGGAGSAGKALRVLGIGSAL